MFTKVAKRIIYSKGGKQLCIVERVRTASVCVCVFIKEVVMGAGIHAQMLQSVVMGAQCT